MTSAVQLTPGRRAWLVRLLHSPTPLRRSQGPVGHDCMRAGWTEWAYVDARTGALIGNYATAESRFGAELAAHARRDGETLTSAGRAILQQPG
jgi:hypothetical protein